MSIRLKLVLALFLGLLAIAGATAVLMRFVHERGLALASANEVAQAAATMAQLETMEIGRMAAILDALSANDALAERFAARDREGLLALASPIFEPLWTEHGITHWYFHPPDPVADGTFLRVHSPALRGDPVRRAVVSRAIATGERASGRELGRTAFAVRVVAPWRREGRLLGYLELGMDVPTFLGRLKAMSGDEYAMVLAKSRLDRLAWGAVAGEADSWDSRAELVTVEATMQERAIIAGVDRLADIPDAPTVLDHRSRGGRAHVRGIFPLVDAGEKVGAVVMIQDVSALHEGVAELRGRVILLVALLAAGLAALVIFLLEALVFERLARMSRALEDYPARLARGEHGFEETGPDADDEVGRFEAFFRRTLREIGSFVSDVRRDPPGRRSGRGSGGD